MMLVFSHDHDIQNGHTYKGIFIFIFLAVYTFIVLLVIIPQIVEKLNINYFSKNIIERNIDVLVYLFFAFTIYTVFKILKLIFYKKKHLNFF